MTVYFTVSEVAEILGLNKQTIQKLIKKGKILAHKEGVHYLVSERETKRQKLLYARKKAWAKPVPKTYATKEESFKAFHTSGRKMAHVAVIKKGLKKNVPDD